MDAHGGAVALVLEALTLLRKNSLDVLPDILLEGKPSDGPLIQARDTLYHDQSILAGYCHVFDVGARRLLPSNLLRRSQVLSVLPRPKGCHVRTAVCSKSGEEGIILWKLVSKDGIGKWHVSSANLEGLIDGIDIPRTLHPRYSPESIIHAYLTAMKKREYTQAQLFCNGIVFNQLSDDLLANGYSRNESGMLFIEPVSKGCLNSLMSLDSHSCIVKHREWVLGKAVLSNPKQMVQEVIIKGEDPLSDWEHWIFQIDIHDYHGCWTIHAIDRLY